MDFSCIISRANLICETKGIDKRIYTKSGAGKDFVSNIKKGSAPSVEKVYALAEYLDCSVDYLLGRTDNPQLHNNTSSVSVGNVSGNNDVIGVDNKTNDPGESYIVIAKDEQELLNNYRSLNDLGKNEARKRINELTKLEQYKSSDDSEEEIFISVAARKARTNNRKLKKRNSNTKISDLPDYKG